jgi:hypothetical protein
MKIDHLALGALTDAMPTTSPLAPAASDLVPGQIGRSRLTIGATVSFDAFSGTVKIAASTHVVLLPIADYCIYVVSTFTEEQA